MFQFLCVAAPVGFFMVWLGESGYGLRFVFCVYCGYDWEVV